MPTVRSLGRQASWAGKEETLTKLEIIRDGTPIGFRTMDLKYLEPGDIMVSRSGGGGGIGDPLEREVEKVRRDVIDEYVSIEAARSVYGVVMDPETFEVDEEATAALRTELKGHQNSEG